MVEQVETVPRWDLTNVYPALESAAFKADFAMLDEQLDEIEGIFMERVVEIDGETDVVDLKAVIEDLLDLFNAALIRANTLEAYLFSFVSTDSYNLKAKKLLSEFEQIKVRIRKQQVRLQSFIGRIVDRLPLVLAQDGSALEHAFVLKEAAEQSQYLMSEPEESLAAELNLSGGNAWGKLQGTVTSQLSVDFELDGELKELPMPALVNLRTHPDQAVRKRAYEAEMLAWESVEEPLAAAMNGVKGAVNTLNQRRGRIDAVHSAIDSARIDRETLDAMLAAMRASFPSFRKYFRAKAARFGQQRLPWWNLFAPTGKTDTRYSFQEARDFILENFQGFSPELFQIAEKAFDNDWIDAEQRPGKRGGAFCMSVPAVKESRILCNFDGSQEQVFTIAHELGHAFHNYCAYEAGKTPLQRLTPMTLAETASIMCETIITEAVLAQVSSPEQELAILETSLISDAQTIVDIYSRYIFESEVFERRVKSELSAEDFCGIMERAQLATYGDGLDENFLHKYMWTWKPHYYRAGLSFYNFPYAFGLLFGTGLYAIYRQRGEEFVPDYMALLASTGEATAADLASRFGIDIREQRFWESSLEVIAARIERYVEL